MPDLKKYDNSVALANANKRNAIFPLLSWDIYGAFFHNLKKNHEDFLELEQIATSYKWKLELNLREELNENDTIIVTNPNLEIVFASNGILEMSGYKPNEVVGQTPKIFQGKNTSAEKRAEINVAILNQQPFEVTLINYKKDGKSYDCHIRSFPIFNKKGQLTHFIALEKAA